MQPTVKKPKTRKKPESPDVKGDNSYLPVSSFRTVKEGGYPLGVSATLFLLASKVETMLGYFDLGNLRLAKPDLASLTTFIESQPIFGDGHRVVDPALFNTLVELDALRADSMAYLLGASSTVGFVSPNKAASSEWDNTYKKLDLWLTWMPMLETEHWQHQKGGDPKAGAIRRHRYKGFLSWLPALTKLRDEYRHEGTEDYVMSFEAERARISRWSQANIKEAVRSGRFPRT